jgi:hypothetical protein
MHHSIRRSWIILLLSGAAMFPQTVTPRAADLAPEPVSEFQRAFFDDASFTLHVRSYLLDRYDGDSTNGVGANDPGAWALGGWVGYETGWIGDVLRFGAVGYTSQPMWAPEDRDGTLLLMPGQEGYSVLGQAYVALKFEEQVLTLFRQLVNQPEVNAQDNRMTPNTFEGGSLKGELGPVSYYGGVLTAMKKRNEIDFINIANAAGVNEDSYMYLGGLEFSPIDELKARTSLYVVPDLLASSYTDAGWTMPLTEEAKFRLAGQFMIQSAIGEEYMSSDVDAWIGGIKGDMIWNGLTLTAGYTINGEDNAWQAPYGSWPGYTGMIVKDFNRAEEQALLLGGSIDFAVLGAEGLGFTAAMATDLDVAQGQDEWTEYDFTADYRLSALDGDLTWLAPLWLRARYALVEVDDTDGTDYQIDDFRVIVNYELQFTGSDI